MKILIIGGNGTIGRKVSERLSEKHEVIVAGRSSGDVQVDFSDSKSISGMFEEIGKIKIHHLPLFWQNHVMI